jgi:hypothetical protein
MANLASRFGIIARDKMGAEMVPILGAFGGASINLLFVNHFQAAARGHFIVRRLERKHGGQFVKTEYEKVLKNLEKGPDREGVEGNGLLKFEKECDNSTLCFVVKIRFENNRNRRFIIFDPQNGNNDQNQIPRYL